MPLILNEQQEKKDSFILKYDSENTLKIKSNLYKLPFHYLNEERKSVACKGDICVFCEKGLPRRTEYSYYVSLNGKLGVMDIKQSVFFDINAIEKASKRDKKKMVWLVLKHGQGKETRYTVSKDDNLSSEEYEKVEAELGANNAKLEKFMHERETSFEENYYAYSPEQQTVPEEEAEEEGSDSEIPF